MKHLKSFENNNQEPEVGDYVICEDCVSLEEEFKNFMCNNIGLIVEINPNTNYPYTLYYENIPDNIIDGFSCVLNNNYEYDYKCLRAMSREEIIHFSKNKEDLETILASNKYNL